jgi:hypothetical protein
MPFIQFQSVSYLSHQFWRASLAAGEASRISGQDEEDTKDDGANDPKDDDATDDPADQITKHSFAFLYLCLGNCGGGANPTTTDPSTIN